MIIISIFRLNVLHVLGKSKLCSTCFILRLKLENGSLVHILNLKVGNYVKCYRNYNTIPRIFVGTYTIQHKWDVTNRKLAFQTLAK